MEVKGQAIWSGHLAWAGFSKARDTHGDVTVDHLPFLKGRQNINTVSPLDPHCGLCHLMIPCCSTKTFCLPSSDAEGQGLLGNVVRCAALCMHVFLSHLSSLLDGKLLQGRNCVTINSEEGCSKWMLRLVGKRPCLGYNATSPTHSL